MSIECSNWMWCHMKFESKNVAIFFLGNNINNFVVECRDIPLHDLSRSFHCDSFMPCGLFSVCVWFACGVHFPLKAWFAFIHTTAITVVVVVSQWMYMCAKLYVCVSEVVHDFCAPLLCKSMWMVSCVCEC